MSRPASVFLRSLRASCRRPTRSLAAAPATITVFPLKSGVSWFEDSGDESTSNFRSKSSWNSTWYFAVAGVFTLSSISSVVPATCSSSQEAEAEKGVQIPKQPSKKPIVVFVLGGPGSGKGTQCAKIVDTYGFTHLSAGELLRAEIKSGSPYGQMIHNTIKEGKIVPSEVTVKLLQKAMQESGNDKFLIDGFPRNEENRTAFEAVTGIEPEFILFFDCTEEEMEKRLLNRNQGRADDNIETIKKRFRVFIDSSLPVVQYYEKKGKVHKIDANRNVEDIFASLKPIFSTIVKEDLLNVTKEMLQCIDIGDYETYTKLCDPTFTSFEPEAQGHLLEGLDFHKFFFDIKEKTSPQAMYSNISSPHVSLLSDDVAIVAYTRLRQRKDADGRVNVESFNETRVWQRKRMVQAPVDGR